jgi:exopolysaccharide biosynthesis polyprenyl glycosylphosphotransferase
MVILFNQRVPLVAVIDLLLAGLVFLSAFGFVAAAQSERAPELILVVAAACGYAASQLAALAVFGVHRIDRSTRALAFVSKLSLSLLVGALGSYALLSVVPDIDVFRELIPRAVLYSAAGVIIVRLALGSDALRDAFGHRVLVLGTGGDAKDVEKALQSYRSDGVEVVGFYPIGTVHRLSIPRDKLLSDDKSIEELAAELRVHEIIVAVREQRGGRLPIKELLNCRLRGVRVTDLPGFFERVTGEVPVESLKASWLVFGDGFRQSLQRRIVKRAFDMSAALGLLVVTLPVILLAGIAIFLESGRPIFFRQERVGLGGRSFNVLKFRSMRTDAEKDGIPKWAQSGDPRVTKVGKFIRRTRIDELPQIFNVLKGEMSFVGPRPERPYFVAQLSE